MDIFELCKERAILKQRLREIEQELCPHDQGTYYDCDWSYHGNFCKLCHKAITYVSHYKKE